MTLRTRLAVALSALVVSASALTFASASSRKADTRVFELRTYITEPGRLDALNKRFREHTTKLFEKHGMTNIGYWTPQDEKQGKGNTLIYLLAHESREAAKKSWAAFGSDPEWNKAREASEKDGKIVKSVTSVYMDPTDYSAMK